MSFDILDKYIASTIKGMKTLTPEKIEHENNKMFTEYKEAYSDFREKFDKGVCCYCSKSIKTFSKTKPCLHWFLRPKGVKKKHINDALIEYGYYGVDTYLRWVANTEVELRNINDINTDETKLINHTIKYNNFEWSFSCAFSDLKGHGKSNYPHFHFQFRIDKKQFVNFNDFHIPFIEHDLWRLGMQNQKEIPYQYNQGYGMGINDILNDEVIEEVMNEAILSDNEENAMFDTGTLIMAKPGETISGSDLLDLMKESKETGIPMSRLGTKLGSVETYVSEGKGVVEQASRTKTNRGKKI